MEKNKNSEAATKLAVSEANLTELVDYQDGSIVSRTLIDKKAGTVTLFAFDAKQGLSEHITPFDALLYVFDGEAEVIVSGNPLHLKAGMTTILPAGETHSVRSVSRFKMMLVMIRS